MTKQASKKKERKNIRIQIPKKILKLLSQLLQPPIFLISSDMPPVQLERIALADEVIEVFGARYG